MRHIGVGPEIVPIGNVIAVDVQHATVELHVCPKQAGRISPACTTGAAISPTGGHSIAHMARVETTSSQVEQGPAPASLAQSLQLPPSLEQQA